MIAAIVDAWRRVVPGRPRIDRPRFYAEHSQVPLSLPRHQLALVGGSEEQPRWAAFECPCGTGHRIMLPLARRSSPRWRLVLEGRTPSLEPSIDSLTERRCHFWLRDGRVRWAPSRRRGRNVSVR